MITKVIKNYSTCLKICTYYKGHNLTDTIFKGTENKTILHVL